MNVLNAPQPLRRICRIFGSGPLILPFCRSESRPGTITAKEAFAQLRADLTGKDSHRGVTLSYTWLANQFGHFSLGFIPSMLLVHFFSSGLQSGALAGWAALRVSLFWTLFEVLNFLGPLLIGQSRKAFAPAWKNIAFDTITDILFFCFGASVAASLGSASPGPVVVATALGILLMPMSYHWYLTKIYQQRAAFPKQLRLGQWAGHLRPADCGTITGFMNGNAGQHLLIFGDDAALCSDLGIALANELAIAHRSCRYVSAAKLAAQREGAALEDIATLLVDDLNSGGVAEHEAVLPERLLHAYHANGFNSGFGQRRNTIWILAGVPESRQQAWIAALERAGVRREQISGVRANVVQESGQNVIVVSERYQVRQAFDLEALV